jgi:omega-hydroxy-beta-dihydromenaquinone-9 sulfotransferase
MRQLKPSNHKGPRNRHWPTLLYHPLAINSFRHWRRIRSTGSREDAQHWLRAAYVTLVSPLCAPLRLLEKRLYRGAIDAIEISRPPVFIIGHWRTGTTLLHNLLGQDPCTAYMSTLHSLVPASFHVSKRILRPLVARQMPTKRAMDNMPLSLDLPQEEEFALCNITPHSFYVGWYFPERMPDLFQRYVLFEGLSQQDREEWRSTYVHLVKGVLAGQEDKRLVLKNPVNTGRIPALLEIFPDAKFVHLCRDPFQVYLSTQWLHRAIIDLIGFQSISDEQIRANVLVFFEEMTRRYLQDRKTIPATNLIEMRFEELVADPVGQTARLYGALNLSGWEQARPGIETYAAGLSAYRTNQFHYTNEDVETVADRWRLALDVWGYAPPTKRPAEASYNAPSTSTIR